MPRLWYVLPSSGWDRRLRYPHPGQLITIYYAYRANSNVQIHFEAPVKYQKSFVSYKGNYNKHEVQFQVFQQVLFVLYGKQGLLPPQMAGLVPLPYI